MIEINHEDLKKKFPIVYRELYDQLHYLIDCNWDQDVIGTFTVNGAKIKKIMFTEIKLDSTQLKYYEDLLNKNGHPEANKQIILEILKTPQHLIKLLDENDKLFSLLFGRHQVPPIIGEPDLLTKLDVINKLSRLTSMLERVHGNDLELGNVFYGTNTAVSTNVYSIPHVGI